MKPSEIELNKRPDKRPNILLRLLGPGLVTGAADDDPSGIATYSQAGAQFGYGLLWTVFLTTPFMIAIQLVSAQIGRVTGKGIIANVKDFTPRWLVISLVSILVMANTFNIAADLAAMGEALSLVVGGLNHEHALIFAATSVLLQVFVRYRRYAPALKFLTLVLFFYVATAFTVHIPWGKAFARAVWPADEVNRDYLLMVVAVLGTTISPYLFFWQASQEVEEMKQNQPRRPLRTASFEGAIAWRRSRRASQRKTRPRREPCLSFPVQGIYRSSHAVESWAPLPPLRSCCAVGAPLRKSRYPFASTSRLGVFNRRCIWRWQRGGSRTMG
jgi:NRAMP (natural resistance-associated macrophage protein)-like metal ion transporter